MGDPRKLQKTYKRPYRPWEKDRIETELVLLGDYGLRNKKELWKHANQLRRFRQIARELKTVPEEIRIIGSEELIGRLNRLGLVTEDATTDDILSLTVRDILERRLQTLVHKRGLSRSIYQARQFVVHKHISVDGKTIASPSYLVKKAEEENINFDDFSPYNGNPEKVFGISKEAEKKKKKKGGRKRKTKKKSKKSKKKSKKG
ncbi:MAG: 30S ribosomal protein S4 [Candidatus Lokiarchaeota archaeon]|nr:30S ribosomal protein S4 [Candidatus Lokiarchaeota archaeon]